jgi:thiamine-phosphate pyrophosphorylase
VAAFDLCVITDRAAAGGLEHAAIAERALRGGATIIQLRDKTLGGRDLLAAARAIQAMCRAHGATCIVNDRVDIALAAGADGAHVGQADLPAPEARALLRGRLLGVSAHAVEEAAAAQAAGADYVGVGAIYPTTSKANARAPLGPEAIARFRAAVRIPIVAIGGITLENVEPVIRAGADGVAVIAAVVGAPDIAAAARALRARIAAARAAPPARR